MGAKNNFENNTVSDNSTNGTQSSNGNKILTAFTPKNNRLRFQIAKKFASIADIITEYTAPSNPIIGVKIILKVIPITEAMKLTFKERSEFPVDTIE